MTKISGAEFEQLCSGIYEDREAIYKHNPIGTREETLLWMLLGCLNSYLSLPEIETPCFTGRPDEQTYRDAIFYVLNDRKKDDFEPDIYLKKLLQ